MPMLDCRPLTTWTVNTHTHAHTTHNWIRIRNRWTALLCFALCAIFGNEQIVFDNDNSKLKPTERSVTIQRTHVRQYDECSVHRRRLCLCAFFFCCLFLFVSLLSLNVRYLHSILFSATCDVRDGNAFVSCTFTSKLGSKRRFRLRVRTNRL